MLCGAKSVSGMRLLRRIYLSCSLPTTDAMIVNQCIYHLVFRCADDHVVVAESSYFDDQLFAAMPPNLSVDTFRLESKVQSIADTIELLIIAVDELSGGAAREGSCWSRDVTATASVEGQLRLGRARVRPELSNRRNYHQRFPVWFKV